MGMAAVIYKKGAPDNFVWEETNVGSPERGQVRLRSTAVGVNFADTYHRAGIPHPMIVGDPPVVVGFEGVGEIEELGPGVTGFSVGERVCTCLPPLGAYVLRPGFETPGWAYVASRRPRWPSMAPQQVL